MSETVAMVGEEGGEEEEKGIVSSQPSSCV